MPDSTPNLPEPISSPEPAGERALSSLSAMLAFDIASELRSVPELLQAYSLTEDELKHLLENDIFRGMVREARARWKTDLNATERIRAKAAIATEEVIRDVHAMATNADNTVTARLDAVRTLHELSGLKGQQKEGGDGKPADRFAITINVGGETVKIAHGPAPLDVTP